MPIIASSPAPNKNGNAVGPVDIAVVEGEELALLLPCLPFKPRIQATSLGPWPVRPRTVIATLMVSKTIRALSSALSVELLSITGVAAGAGVAGVAGGGGEAAGVAAGAGG